MANRNFMDKVAKGTFEHDETFDEMDEALKEAGSAPSEQAFETESLPVQPQQDPVVEVDQIKEPVAINPFEIRVSSLETVEVSSSIEELPSQSISLPSMTPEPVEDEDEDLEAVEDQDEESKEESEEELQIPARRKRRTKAEIEAELSNETEDSSEEDVENIQISKPEPPAEPSEVPVPKVEKNSISEGSEISIKLLDFVKMQTIKALIGNHESEIYTEAFTTRLLQSYVDGTLQEVLLFKALIQECIENNYRDAYLGDMTEEILKNIGDL